jgi:hypothetical protein
VLAQGALSARIEITSREQILARHGEGAAFGFERLSDGERNAVLLAIEVVTTHEPSVFLLDEPERHLHRSIIEPLVAGLLADRSDSIFILGTHEIDLPASFESARTLIIRHCSWGDRRVVGWDANLLTAGSLPDNLRHAVLGSRRRMLFVEGTTASLDRSLYALLFPDVSIVSKESCRHVIQAVAGLRSSEDLHWLHAVGLIDRDDRPASDVEDLQRNGIIALAVTSIEALYYGAFARRSVAARQAETLGKSAAALLDAARDAALRIFAAESTKMHLVARRCERLLRNELMSKAPSAAELRSGVTDLRISLRSPYSDEISRYDQLLAGQELESMLALYPARESGALDAIAKALHFSGRKDYEQAVLAAVARESTTREQLIASLEPLGSMLDQRSTAE